MPFFEALPIKKWPDLHAAARSVLASRNPREEFRR